MNVKKAINTIVPLRIFSSRNMSSLGLVFLFFLLYIIAGGSIGTENLRAIKNSNINQGFGTGSIADESENPYDNPSQIGVIVPPISVTRQEEVKLIEEIAKAREEKKAEVDADWEKLNNKLKGIHQN